MMQQFKLGVNKPIVIKIKTVSHFTTGAQHFVMPFELEVIPDENEIDIDPGVKGDCDMNPTE